MHNFLALWDDEKLVQADSLEKSRLAKHFDQVGIMNSTTPKNLRKERPTHATEALWRLAILGEDFEMWLFSDV